MWGYPADNKKMVIIFVVVVPHWQSSRGKNSTGLE